MKTALVTGCAGFIGSHLAEHLLIEGLHVTGIDCFTDNYAKGLKKINICNIVENPMWEKRFRFIEADLLTTNLKDLLWGIDYVFHLAATPGVLTSWGRDFSSYTNNNVLATQRLLEACRETEIKKFVYASSSSVYGNVDELPMREGVTHPNPISPYGVTKLAGESLCEMYGESFGVFTVSLRYFTVYGPRQRPDMAIHKFLKIAQDTKKFKDAYSWAPVIAITIYGDGNQTRDFTYIDDVIDATYKAGIKTVEGIINIGGGSQITVNNLIKIIEKVTEVSIKVEHIDCQEGDVKDTASDNSLALGALGYEPKVSLEEGIRKEWEWLTK